MRYIIEGGKPIKGKIKISGSKNSALAIIAASLILKNKTILRNVPDIEDINIMIKIANSLGSKTSFFNNTLTIYPFIKNNSYQKELCSKIRSSLYFLAPLLSYNDKIILNQPGGCGFGSRPIDFHLNILRKLGATVNEKEEFILIEKTKLTGTNITLPYPSFGATVNFLLLSLIADSPSSIKNYAKEPEIFDLINFLKIAGADIIFNQDKITIMPLNQQAETIDYTIMPDRIEAFTFLTATALTNGEIEIQNCNPEHLQFPLKILKEFGYDPIINSNSIYINCSNNRYDRLNQIDVTTSPYPGFPTDLQPIITPLLAKSKKSSKITDAVFKERFVHISEFKKFGINYSLNKNTITLSPSIFQSSKVSCPDIRAGAALVLVALASPGISEISNIEKIQRGYENFDRKLKLLGANINLMD